MTHNISDTLSWGMTHKDICISETLSWGLAHNYVSDTLSWGLTHNLHAYLMHYAGLWHNYMHIGCTIPGSDAQLYAYLTHYAGPWHTKLSSGVSPEYILTQTHWGAAVHDISCVFVLISMIFRVTYLSFFFSLSLFFQSHMGYSFWTVFENVDR